jgi:basic membrane lipoprotein Med (substrate-binding protein (PBP1-ABC) superfamily)
MRAISILALTAFLGLTIAASFTSAYAAAPGAMSGKGDFATRGYNQAAKEKQGQIKKGPKTVKPKPQ